MHNIILCGFKNSGKSYFGKLLAEKLEMVFLDTDKLIEDEHDHRPCAEITRRWGEEVFRSLESRIIASLRSVKSSVISLGGGALLASQNRAVLANLGLCVYLFLEKQELKNRLLKPPLPSFLQGRDPAAAFEKMYVERVPQYESVSHLKVSIDKLSTQQVLQAIEERWVATRSE